jgi:hypothetical protein
VGQKRESGEFRKWKRLCSPRSNLAQADDVEFRITVNVTGGWIGFGFSPNGGMRGSDIVLAWLNADGSPSFSDRHATANALPSVDKQQDYELLELSQDARAATTTLRFRRKLTTCDADDALLSGTARVIYAWGVETPVDGVPRYHEARRGSRSVNILNEAPLGAPPTERDVQLFDIVFNNTLAPKQYGRTRYLLKAFQFPLFEKHHVVGSQMLIPESELPAAHHMLVYLCNFPLNETELAYAGPKRGAPQSLRSCNLVRPIAGWAVGGLDVWLPKEFGFPVGQDENNRFVVCELHLDVAAEDEDYFTRVGIRFHVTKTLRPHDGAVVSIGANVDNFLLVAPNAQVQRRGYCVSECTTEGLIPKEGMLIFGTMLHGHTAATGIEVRHIRADGVELAPLARDATYDFNLQNWNWLAQPRLFSPGDQFVTTCNYSTLGRTVPTLGGEATSEEMCLVYMLTYSPSGPVEINTCMSTGTPNLLATLILNNAFAGATPTSFFNTSDFFRNNVSDWSKYETVLQNALNSNTPTVQPFCLKNSGNFTFGLGRNVRSFRPRVPYVEPQLCAVPTTVAATSTAPPSTSTDTAAHDVDRGGRPPVQLAAAQPDGVADRVARLGELVQARYSGRHRELVGNDARNWPGQGEAADPPRRLSERASGAVDVERRGHRVQLADRDRRPVPRVPGRRHVASGGRRRGGGRSRADDQVGAVGGNSVGSSDALCQRSCGTCGACGVAERVNKTERAKDDVVCRRR